MPGVMFSKSAAKRIADGIRKVEGIPGGEQDLQRRRAGGLGRSTLWEVTAVQPTADPKTVTIKRISNIGFDLNDPSEKTDILYDPGDEPAVGDRGLLIRLGEGSLFFFRRPALNRIYINEHCYVKSDDPNNAFGAPNTAFIRTNLDNSILWTGVFKFERTLPQQAAKDQMLVLGGHTGFSPLPEIVLPFSGFTHYYIDLAYIKQDFIPSTLTYTQYQALSKSILQNIGELYEFRTRHLFNVNFRECNSWKDSLAITRIQLQQIFSTSFTVYGIAISGHWSQTIPGGNYGAAITRTPTQGGKYKSWIEWNI